VTVSIANHNPLLRFGVTSSRNATFVSHLFRPVVFANSAKFVTEACVKPVTANCGEPVGKAASVG